jgi:hypothetical protein
MKQKGNESDDLAEQILTNLGFEVQCLPESTKAGQKTADFFVTFDGHSAIIEAKLKISERDKTLERKEILDKNEVYSSEEVSGRSGMAGRIIEKATKQLLATSIVNADFKVIFITVDCIHSKALTQQFVDTLYGLTSIIHLEKNLPAKPCYFSRKSHFFEKPEVDAVIIATNLVQSDFLLIRGYLNPFSPRYEVLKFSSFLSPLGEDIVDPMEEERNGEAYIVGEDYDRTQSRALKGFVGFDPLTLYLEQKYQTGRITSGDFKMLEITKRFS